MLSNTIIVKGVEEALFEATENFLNSQNWRDDYFKLKAFSFIFANALEELLKNERKIKSSLNNHKMSHRASCHPRTANISGTCTTACCFYIKPLGLML